MKHKILYKITNKEAEMVISNWRDIYERAQSYINEVTNRRTLMKQSISDDKPLDDYGKAFLDDEAFRLIRKALNPYTHRLKDLITQLESSSTNMPITKDNLDRLKEISLSATTWYATFNNTVSAYRSTKQIYEICFVNKYAKIN